MTPLAPYVQNNNMRKARLIGGYIIKTPLITTIRQCRSLEWIWDQSHSLHSIKPVLSQRWILGSGAHFALVVVQYGYDWIWSGLLTRASRCVSLIDLVWPAAALGHSCKAQDGELQKFRLQVTHKTTEDGFISWLVNGYFQSIDRWIPSQPIIIIRLTSMSSRVY